MSRENPLVSIIIPTYNRAHLIGETLDSVLAQTYQNWECIVVDDGSTDNTEELMADYMAKDPRFQYHHRPKDRLPGGNAARNYGFEVSRGEFVQWFDSDDLMMADKLEIQINELLDTSSKIHLCTGISHDINTKSFNDLRINLSDNIFRQVALNTSEIMTPSILIDRKTYCASNISFKEELTRGQETYFLIDLISNVDKTLIYQSEKKLFQYNLHNQSISKSDNAYNSQHAISKAIVFSRIWFLNKKHGDSDIANKMYRKCIRLLFSSLRNKDYDISALILKQLKINLKLSNSGLYFRILVYYILLKKLKKPNYRLMNNLLKLTISSK